MHEQSVMIADDPPEQCREQFPVLRDCVYLDTGSAGLTFSGQARAAAQFYEDKAQGYSRRDLWLSRGTAIRQRIADWLDVLSGEIEFFSGTTDALNIVAHSIDWQPGDEIVVAADEFASVRLAWLVAERAGAIIRLVSIPGEGQREDALIDALSARTRVLVVAHVHSITGTRLDLQRLGSACRSHDCLFVVDGIHALGATPVDLDQVDVYVSGVFKWLLSGFGLAIAIIRERARKELRPAFRGYLNQPPDDGLQFAHVNYPGLYALEASLQLLGETIGWPTVHARTAALVQWLADELQAGGLELAAPKGARAGIASVLVPDSEGLRRSLAEQEMYVAAKGKYLRVSPFFYNSRRDIERFAAHFLRLCS